jgi:putative ABC transport system substrate-binding protein
MNRREFMAVLGGLAATWPFAAQGQPKMPVIGYLGLASPETYQKQLAAFQQGLRQGGFVEGRNVTIEYRWAKKDYRELPHLADELVGDQVSLLYATGGSKAALAAKAATTTIPIVFAFGDGDPVEDGLVTSIDRPGGNVTGVMMIAGLLGPKRVQLLHELVPKATVIYLLVNPSTAGLPEDLPATTAAIHELRLAFKEVKASTLDEIDAAFISMAREQAQALMVANDVYFTTHASEIVELSTRYHLPAIYPWREYADAGGLMSYGTNLTDGLRHSGIYVAEVLKGKKPADLPVQQPTKFELIINLKAAKLMDLTVPAGLLIAADEVIE